MVDVSDASTAGLRRSVVVTGGSQGVGAAIAALLAKDAHVIVLDVASTMSWEHPSASLVSGDARDPAVARRAAEEAEAVAPLTGWVNNAAIFRDATVATATAPEILDMITANLGLALTGSHTAVAHFLRHRRAGAIVNVSSHQAQRPVRGALPYATSKAAIEGLTKALAVDHGPAGIRTNAVALGSIATARYEQYRREHPGVDDDMAALHPLGRVGLASEVAETVAFLLSDRASFLNGVIVPVDGGRAVQGADPEAR
jgi:NAD(P)-dependent dehydrogenase (short-subunit alcohol dehydrogenase family)